MTRRVVFQIPRQRNQGLEPPGGFEWSERSERHPYPSSPAKIDKQPHRRHFSSVEEGFEPKAERILLLSAIPPLLNLSVTEFSASRVAPIISYHVFICSLALFCFFCSFTRTLFSGSLLSKLNIVHRFFQSLYLASDFFTLCFTKVLAVEIFHACFRNRGYQVTIRMRRPLKLLA